MNDAIIESFINGEIELPVCINLLKISETHMKKIDEETVPFAEMVPDEDSGDLVDLFESGLDDIFVEKLKPRKFRKAS